MVSTGEGAWVLPLAEVRTADAGELRIQCSLGSAARSVFRVPVAAGIPRRLRLGLWPESLSTDFPVAEVQVALAEKEARQVMPVLALEMLHLFVSTLMKKTWT